MDCEGCRGPPTVMLQSWPVRNFPNSGLRCRDPTLLAAASLAATTTTTTTTTWGSPLKPGHYNLGATKLRSFCWTEPAHSPQLDRDANRIQQEFTQPTGSKMVSGRCAAMISRCISHNVRKYEVFIAYIFLTYWSRNYPKCSPFRSAIRWENIESNKLYWQYIASDHITGHMAHWDPTTY
jgi:hypothetical protein